MAIKQPKDKSHFILPDLGEGVHEAELIRWRVKPGQQIEEHGILAEMETDKALVEVPSPWSGTIAKLHGSEGEILNVGSVLVEYETTGAAAASTSSRAADAPESRASGAGRDTAKGGSANDSSDGDAGTVVGSVDSTLKVSDAFTRRRPERAAATARKKSLATPAVRRLARETGVNIDEVPATGRGGRVTASDIQSHIRTLSGLAPQSTATLAPSAPPAPAPAISPDGIAHRIPFRGVRRKIAEALSRSIHTAVHFTVVDEADVTTLEAKRREYSAVLGRKLSLLPFVMTAVSRALRTHPELNANVDDERGEILLKSVINIGCAVDTDHGLMVPVISSADTLNITQLAESVADLATKCRDRTIDREKLTGGTFTISNVGSHGGMFATPIINYPEVGILAVGRAKERVLTRNGAFYAGRVLPLSMSCDHRVVDGALGAQFLATVVKLLENPDALLGV